jgi:dTDP-4-dehydrorhamnose reductase
MGRILAERPEFRVIPLGRAELNLANPSSFEQVLGDREFDVIVNAAASTGVDDCEVMGDLAYLVNGHAPGILARIAARRGARLIHFSTDFVFDGTQDSYSETDKPNPLSVYGKSKLLGEELVLQASNNHLVVRLSWLFGPGRRAFPEWLLEKARHQPEVSVVGDKMACPTYGMAAARELLPWIQPVAPSTGLLHYCNAPSVIWSDYAQYILEQSHALGLPIQARTITPIPLHSLPGLTARRPLRSALCTDKFTQVCGQQPSAWQPCILEHLRALL